MINLPSLRPREREKDREGMVEVAAAGGSSSLSRLPLVRGGGKAAAQTRASASMPTVDHMIYATASKQLQVVEETLPFGDGRRGRKRWPAPRSTDCITGLILHPFQLQPGAQPMTPTSVASIPSPASSPSPPTSPPTFPSTKLPGQASPSQSVYQEHRANRSCFITRLQLSDELAVIFLTRSTYNAGLL